MNPHVPHYAEGEECFEVCVRSLMFKTVLILNLDVHVEIHRVGTAWQFIKLIVKNDFKILRFCSAFALAAKAGSVIWLLLSMVPVELGVQVVLICS
ncbi:hypothetical protein U1Q18_023797 [Sarracenia purpurea var. burkii]